MIYGGVHASLFPSEARELGGGHAIVKGDGDLIWQEVLADCSNGAPKDYYESHEKDDSGKNESHGHFVSPSTGIHGWWWENKTQNEVTVTLLTAGFYNKAIEFSRTGEKELPVQDAK